MFSHLRTLQINVTCKVTTVKHLYFIRDSILAVFIFGPFGRFQVSEKIRHFGDVHPVFCMQALHMVICKSYTMIFSCFSISLGV